MQSTRWLALAFVTLAASLAQGCGCKRPSVVAEPKVVSYTFEPADAERLARARAALGARAGGTVPDERARVLEELEATQEALRSGARSDQPVSFLSRQICPVLGGAETDCVKSVLAISPARSGERSARSPAPPEQYLVCLKRPVTLAGRARASTSSDLADVGAVLQPNVWWRMKDPRSEKEPSPDEKLAKQASLSNPDWAQKQIDYAGALARLATRRPGRGAGEGVVVVQLDTGFTSSCQLAKAPPAPDLVLDASDGFDFFLCGDEPVDALVEAPLPLEARQPGHGTGTGTILVSPHVSPECHPAEPAGTDGKPLDRVLGIAPAATLIPVRVTDGTILGFPEASKALFEWQGVSFDARVRATTAGLFHAIDRHASVVSISMGGVCADDPVQGRANEELQRWMAEAEEQGIIVVAAAGQFPMPGFVRRIFFDDYPVTFPGSYPSTIAVAASSIYGVPWTQTSRGPKVEITAPGFGVWRAKPKIGAATPEDQIGVGDGTSFSTAITAGVATIWVQYWGRDWLKARYGSATAAAFRLALQRSARQPAELAERLATEAYGPEIRKRARPWDKGRYGAGLLDAARLLSVDMEGVSRSDVCRSEAARLAQQPEASWQQHYDRICGGPS
jgi:hypothetical protein